MLLKSTLLEDGTNADLFTFMYQDVLAVCNLCGLPSYPTFTDLTQDTVRAAVLDIVHHILCLTIEDFKLGDAHPHRYIHWGPIAIGLLYGYIGTPRSDAQTFTQHQQTHIGVRMAKRLSQMLIEDISAGQIDVSYQSMAQVLQDMGTNLGVAKRLPDHQRSAAPPPPPPAV